MADDLEAFRLGLAARRARGEGFVEAWAAELAALPEPEPVSQANVEYATADALMAARSSWRRAFEGAPPTALDRAAARLGQALALLEEEPPLLKPVRTPPMPAIPPKTPTAAGAAAAAAFRRRGWWKRGAAAR